MTRDQIADGASAVLSILSNYEKPRDKRAVLRKALAQVQVNRVTDDAIAALFVPGLAFPTRKIADVIGCTTRRVAKVAEARGCTKISNGVYQAPSAS